MCGCRVDSSGLEWEEEAESFALDNELSISIICGEFEYLKNF